MEKYGAVQVHYDEVVLLCLLSAYYLKFVVYCLVIVKWLSKSDTTNFFEVALAKMDKTVLYVAAMKWTIATQATMHYCLYSC